jgi:predicted RND superfamily exporter protein
MKKKYTYIKRFETAYSQWVVKRRWFIIPAMILLVILVASGMKDIKFSNDTRVFFSENNPQLQALEALENTYRKNDNVFYILAPKEGNVFTRETLFAIEELVDSAWLMPYSSRVNSITNFQHTLVEEDDLIVDDLVRNALSMSASEIEYAKKVALSDPTLVSNLISTSGHVTGVIVDFIKENDDLQAVPVISQAAYKLRDEFQRKYPDIDIYLTGNVISDNTFMEAAQNDMRTVIPIMYLVLIVIIGISLRSFSGVFATFLIILMSMLTGLGFAGLTGIQLTAASSNAPSIILTLAVAHSVHILVTLFHQMRHGKAKHEAIIESLRINLKPIIITSVTTSIGFLSMNLSDVPPFRDLGNIVAVGVMASLLYSIMFLPALIAILPVRVKVKAESARKFPMAGLANFVIHYRNPIFWSTIVIVAILSTGISRIELNDVWPKYFSKSFDFRRATDFTEENLTGYYPIDYSLEAGEEGGINNPEYLKVLDDFATWYRKQPKVVNVNSIVEVMKRLNKNMHGDDEAFYAIPDERDLAAQYLLIYEMSLPFGLDLNNQINVDKSSTRFTATLKNATTTEIREMDSRAREWLRANAPEEMYTYGSGLTVIFAHISARNINSMLVATLGALLLISLILIFSLRDVKLGLLSLIPNIIPALLAFSIWGLTVGRVGLGLSIIASLTIGIVVDDTVHFISKYLRARRELNMEPDNAIRYAFNTVGKALWITTLALVAGFMVLSISGYKMNAHMGLMSSLTITIALAFDFLLLPVLILKAEKYKSTISSPAALLAPELVTNKIQAHNSSTQIKD